MDKKVPTFISIMNYFPLMLLPLFFIAEDKIHNHLFDNVCDLCIKMLFVLLFFCLIIKFGIKKDVAFSSIALLWILFILVKIQVKKEII